MTKTPCGPIKNSLIPWYQSNKRDLPWRKTRDPYRIWVSEVMLQQTQVKTVIPYYNDFIKFFSDIRTLADSRLQDVLKSWEGLGYYGRARNLHKAAREMVKKHDARIPDDPAAIKKLPGVGDYISSAVLSIAYNLPHPVVDGNVKRVLSRLCLIDSPVNKPGSHKVFKATAQILLDADDPGTFNQALMELGALVCRPGAPECVNCPLNTQCLALADGVATDYPRRQKSKPIPHHATVAGIVVKNAKVLLTRRKPDGLLGGLWEFPGGGVASDETPETACRRSLKETVNLNVENCSRVTQVKHAYTHFRITMDVYVCSFRSGRVKLNGPIDFRWVKPDQIKTYPLPKSNHKFLPALQKALDNTLHR